MNQDVPHKSKNTNFFYIIESIFGRNKSLSILSLNSVTSSSSSHRHGVTSIKFILHSFNICYFVRFNYIAILDRQENIVDSYQFLSKFTNEMENYEQLG
ncbi:hypothetical protein BLOT_002723 [Blomia tropicalis]|nr:hypothetical protein BLOT_002723 [Blomia tropicalis]